MRLLSITVTVRVTAVVPTTAVIHRLGFQYPLGTEVLECIHLRIMDTRVSIQDSVVTVFQWGIAITQPTAVACIALGIILRTWTTTHPHWFLTVVTWTMFLAITMCIAQAIGTVIGTNLGEGRRLLARCQQAAQQLSPLAVNLTSVAYVSTLPQIPPFAMETDVMTMSKMFFAAALTIFPSFAASTAFAQYGFHVDHHDHVIKDSHGHVIGRYHHDVIHRDAQRIAPHLNPVNHGTYYRQNGHSYYYPQTAMIGTPQVAPTPQEITFGGYGHVEDLAQRLEFLMNDLCLDLYYNYSHNPGFQETYSEAYSLLETAKYIHLAEHAKDRDAISRKLGGADALFHHVEDDVRGWSRVHHRQIGMLGILSKMEMSESVLHHLMQDVGVQAEVPEQAPAPAIGRPELAPPPPSAFEPR